MKKEEIIKLLEEVDRLHKSDEDNILYIDSLERLRLALLLFEKFEASKPSYHISFGRGDWSDDILPFGRLKLFLENLKYSDIIEHLVFAMGGNGFFTVVNKLGFINAIEELVNEVNGNLGKSEEEAQKEIVEHFRNDIINDFKEFRTFVEKDGFLAFWENDKVNGNLKNHPEEIGKSQLMAFLTARGTGYIAREIPAGKGYQDIIFVQNPKAPIIMETKVLENKSEKYNEGLFQLKDYVKKNGQNHGYYIVFQSDNIYNDSLIADENIMIIQIVINISPESPTKVFRENRGN